MGAIENLLEYLLERKIRPDHTFVGAASTAMIEQALTGAKFPTVFPADEHDLARCEETYRRAPLFLRKRMMRTLKLFRHGVKEGGLYCRGCNTFGHRGTMDMLCGECRARGMI